MSARDARSVVDERRGRTSGRKRGRWLGLPRGFRMGHDDSLACPHRDVTCCLECAEAHVEVVDVGGACFWVPNEVERVSMLGLGAISRHARAPARRAASRTAPSPAKLYDSRCEDLARVFLEDAAPPCTEAEVQQLASDVQQLIEDFLDARAQGGAR